MGYIHLVSSDTGSSLQLRLKGTPKYNTSDIEESISGDDNEDDNSLEDVTNDNDIKNLPTISEENDKEDMTVTAMISYSKE